MLKDLSIPFPLFLGLMAASITWLGFDSAQKFNRCTDRHSINYCHVIFHGR
jgi:hypothetical protein